MAQCSRIPTRGPGRLAAIAAVEVVIAADARTTLEEMVAEGWPLATAAAYYRDWWSTLVDAAVDEGVAEAAWRAA